MRWRPAMVRQGPATLAPEARRGVTRSVPEGIHPGDGPVRTHGTEGDAADMKWLPRSEPARPAAPAVRIGPVPALAAAFQTRHRLCERIDRARAGHPAVVLTQVLAGGGGVGKSQLAAAYAHRALADGCEVVVWVNAAEAGQVPAGYAQAARVLREPGA
ncbi:hypothetical protein ACM614_05850, partial [Streptomyces sp. 12297]